MTAVGEVVFPFLKGMRRMQIGRLRSLLRIGYRCHQDTELGDRQT